MARKKKIGRLQFLKAFFTGSLDKPKPKRKTRKVSVDASKGRKRLK